MKHLDPKIAALMQEQNGVKLEQLEIGTTIEAQTTNSLYYIKVLGSGRFEVQGGKHFPRPTTTFINGSTWGGSMIKTKWLGIDMRIEMGHPLKASVLTTSPVQSLRIIGPDGSWNYLIEAR